MKFDSLPRVMALCMVIWGVPMTAMFMVMDYRQGVLDASMAFDITATSLLGGAFVGAALWFAIGRELVAAKRRQEEKKRAMRERNEAK